MRLVIQWEGSRPETMWGGYTQAKKNLPIRRFLLLAAFLVTQSLNEFCH